MKKKEMLINVLQPEECRIAIVENGILEELYIERANQESYVGNIYKGRIVNIEPSIQAAFVDFGIGRNGFLHVSDVDPAYYKHLLTKEQWEEYERALLSEQEEPRGGSTRRGGRRGRSERESPEALARESTLPVTPVRTPTTTPSAEVTHPTALGGEEDYEEEEFAAGIIDDQPTNPGQESSEAESRAHDEDKSLSTADQISEEEEFAAGIMDVSIGDDRPSDGTSMEQRTELPTKVQAQEGTRRDLQDTSVTSDVTSERASAPEITIAKQKTFSDDLHEGATVVATNAPFLEPPPETTSVTTESQSSSENPAYAPAEVPSTIPSSGEPTAHPSARDTVESGSAAAPPPDSSEENISAKETSKPRRRRSGRTATGSDPSSPEAAASPEATEQQEAPTDAPAKPRTRRTRRKSKDTPDQTDRDDTQVPSPGDDLNKPRYMEGAEHRTVPSDEDDIRSFYEGIEDFESDEAPDRSVSGHPSETEPEEVAEETDGMVERLPTEPEAAEQAEEEARELARVPWEEGSDVASAGEEGHRRRGGRGTGRSGDRRSGRISNGGGTALRSSRDRGLPKPKIEQIFKRGQEVIVQVIKEAVGTKGPTLSTYISIAGRYLVLMPSLNRVGVSRKIEDPEARRRLRTMMHALNPPKGVGFIVRTAAVDRDISELRSDLIYLLRLWQVVVRRIKRVAAPVEIYRESDMITRTIRDIFTSDIDTIWVDEPNAFAHASEFLQIVMPKFANRIRYYDSTEPLFHRYGLEEEIAKIYQKRIDLPQGGSIVIEQTEALVAIDVNSGNFRAENNNAEETAFQMNLQAAKEIARQLRLRDLGGVIVNDFIDMRSEVHRRKVEEALREALKRDRARTKILRISQFGIIEMTRQRIRPSIKRSLFAECPHCGGNGYVKTPETVAIEAMRLLQLAAHRAPAVATVQLTVQLDVAHYLLNKRRKDIAALEDRANIVIQITGQPHVSPDTLIIRCFDHHGNEVPLQTKTPKLTGGRIPNGLNRPRDRRQLPAPE